MAPGKWFIRYLRYQMIATSDGESRSRLTFHLQPTPGVQRQHLHANRLGGVMSHRKQDRSQIVEFMVQY